MGGVAWDPVTLAELEDLDLEPLALPDRFESFLRAFGMDKYIHVQINYIGKVHVHDNYKL